MKIERVFIEDNKFCVAIDNNGHYLKHGITVPLIKNSSKEELNKFIHDMNNILAHLSHE